MYTAASAKAEAAFPVTGSRFIQTKGILLYFAFSVNGPPAAKPADTKKATGGIPSMTSVTKNKPNKKNEFSDPTGSFKFVLDLRCAQVQTSRHSLEALDKLPTY